MARIYTFESKRIKTFAIEGTALPLNEGLANYRKYGIFRDSIDMEPVTPLRDRFSHWGAYLHEPEICCLSIFQKNLNGKLWTLSFSYGLGKLEAFNFLKDSAKSFQFQTEEPSLYLKRTVRSTTEIWESFFDAICFDNSPDHRAAVIEAMKSVTSLNRNAMDALYN